MINNAYNADITPGDITVRSRYKEYPMPSKQELLARNSFPSVNENKFLTAWLKQTHRR
ncbi:uncharacterized protein DUF2737 [Yokenella regensburgei]|uniref:Uncharacterized protein DUF2737 n=1 Tax=Yokenella regensburgei TaxID=158877 RepID=A0ABX9RU39_9ENTR|nr:DUF2737 family protein [Yokenella regensburgei]RKR53179.1 uncharacterized protein DUF2737 [Yokenella regensburgei]VFS16133.1 Protein of uncharacterised function (DUF2737) [Yokenella regensburgei]VFS33714.1 Protein of uncharacterised function (DUF2737) [Yokenella regensburgei]